MIGSTRSGEALARREKGSLPVCWRVSLCLRIYEDLSKVSASHAPLFAIPKMREQQQDMICEEVMNQLCRQSRKLSTRS